MEYFHLAAVLGGAYWLARDLHSKKRLWSWFWVVTLVVNIPATLFYLVT